MQTYRVVMKVTYLREMKVDAPSPEDAEHLCLIGREKKKKEVITDIVTEVLEPDTD